MIMLASLVSIQFYFEKRRPLANGIALSGVGFGMMVLPPFYRYLLDRYSNPTQPCHFLDKGDKMAMVIKGD